MSARKITTLQEVEDLVRGVTFFGTGGGGDPEKGLRFLSDTIKEIGSVELVDVLDLPDDATVCSCFYMGSIAPHSEETRKKMRERGMTEPAIDKVLPETIKALERYIGKKIDAIVPVELGGINTPAPIDAAARLKKKVVDGDYAGRAVPEMVQTTPSITNQVAYPMSSVDEWGNVVFIDRTRNHQCSEALGKAISTVAFGLVGQTSWLLSAKKAKELVIRGTITESIKVGRAIREAREKGEDPVRAAAETVDGWVLFKGTVTSKDTDDREGYFWGTTTIEGIENFSGHQFKLWFKNENHLSWFDGEVYVTSPDVMQVIELKTGEPITNPVLKRGDMVAVVGARAKEAITTEMGIERNGPRHYGFDLDYRPIEDVIKKYQKSGLIE